MKTNKTKILPRTIAISGLPGSGSTTLAKLLAKKLHYKVYLAGQEFKALSKAKSEMERTIEVWQSIGRKHIIHEKIDRKQRLLARKGKIIIEGKLAIFNLRHNLHVFKIWLNTPRTVRAKQVAKREGISYKKAYKMLVEREKIERQYWLSLYKFDYYKQKKYANYTISNHFNKSNLVNKIINRLEKFRK